MEGTHIGKLYKLAMKADLQANIVHTNVKLAKKALINLRHNRMADMSIEMIKKI
jgi:hypothetical protein